ncbi:MAG: hypothetical protein WCW26_03760 [Candidatus Buchananbacteria bacterium]
MAFDDNKKPDDFFSALAQDQKIENPFASDEILFRDENGVLKILKGGEVLDYNQESKSQPAPVPVSQKPVLPPPVVAAPIPEPNLRPAPNILSQPVKPVVVPEGEKLNIDEEIELVIKKSGIHFIDEEMEKKFRAIVSSRLRHIRDQVQTKEALLNPSENGGMGFSLSQADRILTSVIQVEEQLNAKFRQNISSEPFSDLRSEVEKILSEQPIAREIVYKPQPKVEETQNIAVPVLPVMPKPVTPPSPPLTPVAPVPPKTWTPLTKPKIEDVRFEPRLTGPVEEIRSMSLVDFRRLGKTPVEAIEKIIEKIDLLEEESFAKRNQAIKAWKENEVYRLYLSLGDQSMEERKSISEIINERQVANQPTLTEPEVEAIIELNQRLRY